VNQIFQDAFEYLRSMWRRRLVGIAAAWMVAIAGLVTLKMLPDKYEATARVFVDTQSVLKPLMSGLAVQPNVEQQVSMLSRTLLSRPNVDKLIRMADLDLEARSPEQREKLIERLLKDISISGSSSDNLYTISYREQNTVRAKRVVDSLLTIFVESGLGGNRRDTQKAQQFINQQIQDYERRLQEAERKLKEFKLRNLGQLGGGASSIDSIAGLEVQLGTARVELRAAAQSRDALKRELAGEEPVFLPDGDSDRAGSDAGPIAVPEMDGRIDALRKNLDELLRHFTEEHPDVVGTKRVLADLERQRKEVVDSRRKAMAARASEGRATSVDRNPVYQQLKIALADAEANVASRKGRVDELESKVSELRSTAKLRPELEEEMIQLNRDYQIQKSNYDSLVGRRESAMMTSQLEQSASVADFRVIDPPRTSNTPVAPNRLLLLGLVFGASIAAGAVASLAYSQLFPVFHSLKGLRRALQRPVLGGVSMQDSPAARQRRRLHNLIFFGGLAGLFAVFGSALVLMLLAVRTY
jgi:polysaccharide chain length determinant protein (PEP-CTERM system associated)